MYVSTLVTLSKKAFLSRKGLELSQIALERLLKLH